LVENLAKLEARDNQEASPLHKAAYDGHLDTVKFLVSKGAEKEAKGKE
jgi:ankyrin repeat protein